MMNTNLENEAYELVCELLEIAKAQAGDILVVGCSSSEIMGGCIGKDSNVDTGKLVADGIMRAVDKYGVHLAAQCCEHLNRAIVIEADVAKANRLQPVCVIPQPKAGGSFGTAVYKSMKNPVMVEEVEADMGIDIGQTLIGMHLKKVPVPVRLAKNKLGGAYITAAKTRGKLIGGTRAIYEEV